MLEADIQQLRALTVQVNTAATAIDGIDVRTSGNAIGELLPGSGLGPVCAQAGEFIEGSWLRIAQRLQKLSGIVTTAADDYQVTDEEFAKRLAAMEFQVRGAH
ncbi:hypothetical protein LTV02_35295 [Nocardia yamanashiensis]|uniref:hypothetical protein n=1 Tax=Nocardia yamanashiensis TaxID=209247 RepID=UPI001E4597D2|nr:hypothetical protein [Nocardia yamanashiensis]UGT41154.1 hypothetical protein LTV02_35295 [Nocardia yamanashiensis]